MGRVLGPALRAARGSGRRAGRPLRCALIEDRIEVAGREISLLRPPKAGELIDEAAFDEDEFLPYWAELWPSGVALARAVGGLDLAGVRVLELGAGLGLPSLAAALGGAEVLATDWAEDAVELLRRNAERNGISLRAAAVRWDEPEPLLREAPWRLVLGADLLYERRNADQLLELLPRLGRDALLADPGRPFAKGFLERAVERWRIETSADATTPSVGLHRLRLR
ncbi:MAG TPA: 50S ribosomal protein L11 methyltransferase [Gaiellaceae bacterium]|nr:50S ribosomal protein L11 methyltransferase [Gaiellaceae bacterium]